MSTAPCGVSSVFTAPESMCPLLNLLLYFISVHQFLCKRPQGSVSYYQSQHGRVDKHGQHFGSRPRDESCRDGCLHKQCTPSLLLSHYQTLLRLSIANILERKDPRMMDARVRSGWNGERAWNKPLMAGFKRNIPNRMFLSSFDQLFTVCSFFQNVGEIINNFDGIFHVYQRPFIVGDLRQA